jgi:DNA modification methylase
MCGDGLAASNGKRHDTEASLDAPYARATSQAGQEWEVYRGDARIILPRLPDGGYNCVVTSPPYFWQRNYEEPQQIGLEPTIAGYVKVMADVMDEVKRVLANDGLLFLNLGDTYYSRKGEPKGNDRKNWARRFGLRAVDAKGLGVPRKTTIGMPWRVALEMIERGWTLRSPIIWTRKGSQPEPTAKDRPWRTYETVFMFSKRPVYHFVREPLAGEEDIWTIPTHSKNTNKSMTAFFPEALVRRCLEVGCVPGGRVLDPFAGTGTVLRAALASGRAAVGIELSDKLCATATKSLQKM